MNETIGKRISRLRKEKGMSQEALAEIIGVSSQAVSKWENDQSCPDISLLPKLAKLFAVTTDELLTGNISEVRMAPEGQRKGIEELTLRIRVFNSGGNKTQVNLPMKLVKIGLKMGVQIAPNYAKDTEYLNNLDLEKIIEIVEQGALGKLVEIESANGDIIEIVVE